jgi:hypothetical protein
MFLNMFSAALRTPPTLPHSAVVVRITSHVCLCGSCLGHIHFRIRVCYADRNFRNLWTKCGGQLFPDTEGDSDDVNCLQPPA